MEQSLWDINFPNMQVSIIEAFNLFIGFRLLDWY